MLFWILQYSINSLVDVLFPDSLEKYDDADESVKTTLYLFMLDVLE